MPSIIIQIQEKALLGRRLSPRGFPGGDVTFQWTSFQSLYSFRRREAEGFKENKVVSPKANRALISKELKGLSF